VYAIVAGGGKVGFFLGRELIEQGHEVLIIENNAERAEFIANELGNVVLRGNADEASTLAEAGAERADVVVAVTGDDEDNLVICQMAKAKFETPRTVARVNNPDNQVLFQRLGIDTTVSSTQIIFNLIEQQIEPGEVIPLGALRNGSIEIVTITVSEKSPVLGKPVTALNLPGHSLIISLVRNDNAVLPDAETWFQINDTVIALVTADDEPRVRGIFAEKS
jgi:trk system potassium uptake protein TrkA